MPSAQDTAIVSSFVADAPPGELANVLADIETLTAATPGLAAALGPALQAYDEDQFTTVALPGAAPGAVPAIVCADSALGDGRYADPASASTFAFDHRTRTASDVQRGDASADGPQAALLQAALPALAAYVEDHYARPAFGVYAGADGGATVTVVLVSNKYSPQNFWNGRWRARYEFDPRTGALAGTIRVDVHYYEDGNVRLQTEQPQTATVAAGGSAAATAAALAKAIAGLEKAYQEALNRKFLALSEGAFKSLRRQLPVTRQKIEWDKVASYRLGQDIGGGGGRR